MRKLNQPSPLAPANNKVRVKQSPGLLDDAMSSEYTPLETAEDADSRSAEEQEGMSPHDREKEARRQEELLTRIGSLSTELGEAQPRSSAPRTLAPTKRTLREYHPTCEIHGGMWFTPDGKSLVHGGNGGKQLWKMSLSTGQHSVWVDRSTGLDQLDRSNGSTTAVSSINMSDLSSDGTILCVAADDGLAVYRISLDEDGSSELLWDTEAQRERLRSELEAMEPKALRRRAKTMEPKALKRRARSSTNMSDEGELKDAGNEDDSRAEMVNLILGAILIWFSFVLRLFCDCSADDFGLF